MLRTTRVLGVAILLAGGIAVAPGIAAQPQSPAKPAAKIETGYLVNLSETGCVLSNLPAGAGGGQPTPGGQGIQVRIGPGDVVRGPDGKLTLSPEAKKRLSPEQQKAIEEALKHSTQKGEGGPTIIRRSAEGSEGAKQVDTSKAPAQKVPLRLTDFTFDAKTMKPKDLQRGDKVIVTYGDIDGKKVVTRIERAK